jgi:hypothetical protein
VNFRCYYVFNSNPAPDQFTRKIRVKHPRVQDIRIEFAEYGRESRETPQLIWFRVIQTLDVHPDAGEPLMDFSGPIHADDFDNHIRPA